MKAVPDLSDLQPSERCPVCGGSMSRMWDRENWRFIWLGWCCDRPSCGYVLPEQR